MAMIKMVPLEEEINNNPQLRKADIDTLREWYNQQPHLPKITDKELALFLHSNYYDLESSKRTIDSYFTMRTHIPEFFSDRDPIENKDIREAMTVGAYFLLKGKTKEGYTTLFCKIMEPNPFKYHFYPNVKYFEMVIDHGLYTGTLDIGHAILYDLRGISFGHSTRAGPFAIKKFFDYLQDSMPVRLKSIHLLNTSPVIDFILKIIKPFMKRELIDILYLHSSLESLSKYMDIDVLPNDCGGKAGTIATLHQESIKNLEENRAWFLYEQEHNRVNEALRPKKSTNKANLSKGKDSFKKLEID